MKIKKKSGIEVWSYVCVLRSDNCTTHIKILSQCDLESRPPGQKSDMIRRDQTKTKWEKPQQLESTTYNMEEDIQEEGTVASWEGFLNKMWDCGENPEGVLGFILGFISAVPQSARFLTGLSLSESYKT